jgi:hypothetical protein
MQSYVTTWESLANGRRHSRCIKHRTWMVVSRRGQWQGTEKVSIVTSAHGLNLFCRLRHLLFAIFNLIFATRNTVATYQMPSAVHPRLFPNKKTFCRYHHAPSSSNSVLPHKMPFSICYCLLFHAHPAVVCCPLSCYNNAICHLPLAIR